MDVFTLVSLFPELVKLFPNPLDLNDFAQLSYFTRYRNILQERQLKGKAQKSHSNFHYIKVKKGTIIYTLQNVADKGYILISGCVQLLAKKNVKQKTSSFPGHFAHTLQQKTAYLHQLYKIPKQKVQQLSSVFYEEKIEFRYLLGHKIYTKQEFGFGEMLRNTSRTQTAIAVEDSQLLVISKISFDTCLRDFQQRKQQVLLAKLVEHAKKQENEDLITKLLPIMNSSFLVKYDNEEIIFNENQFATHVYFIVQGEVEIRKKTQLIVPTKYLKNQNKGQVSKQVCMKINKNSQNSYLGEAQTFLNIKNRQFSAVATTNNTLILKIDHTSFIKAVCQFVHFQKLLIENASRKRAIAMKSFDLQLKKITKAFLSQYQDYDTKKKQKLLSNFINESQKQNQMFEVFAQEKVFYRDTFEKLEGFDIDQKDSNKKSSIKRFKIKNPQPVMSSPILSLSKSQSIKNQQSIQNFDQVEKKLFSPKKSMNPLDFMNQSSANADNQSVQASVSPKEERTSIQKKDQKKLGIMNRHYKSLGKFNEIQKDQKVFKHVLIKHGLYQQDRNIDKSKSVKPVIHKNFDEVVKHCIGRKNQEFKRSSKQRQNQIVTDNFYRTLAQMKKNEFLANSMRFSRFTTPCKGTDQLKKRMQSIHQTPSRMSDHSQLKSSKMADHKLEECMGVNTKPKSSQINLRNNQSPFMSTHQRQDIPEKITFLNHMMKPITYYNFNSIDL